MLPEARFDKNTQSAATYLSATRRVGSDLTVSGNADILCCVKGKQITTITDQSNKNEMSSLAEPCILLLS